VAPFKQVEQEAVVVAARLVVASRGNVENEGNNSTGPNERAKEQLRRHGNGVPSSTQCTYIYFSLFSSLFSSPPRTGNKRENSQKRDRPDGSYGACHAAAHVCALMQFGRRAALLHYDPTYENIETGAPAKHPPVSDRQRHRVQGHSRSPEHFVRCRWRHLFH
jgi:hypothetical protein